MVRAGFARFSFSALLVAVIFVVCLVCFLLQDAFVYTQPHHRMSVCEILNFFAVFEIFELNR